MVPRVGAPFLIAALLASSSAAAAAGLSGTYTSPVGNVRLVEKSGVVTGTFAGGENPCGWKKGATVLDGTRLDDSVTGTLHACKVGDGCAGATSGFVMLLITQQGKLLSGAVHLDAGKCKTPIGGDGITLKRGGAGPGAAQAKAQAKKPPKQSSSSSKSPSTTTKASSGGGGGRAKAEALAMEAQSLAEQGNIEAAREKFLQSIEVDPSYSQGYVGVGVTYYMRDRYDEALDYYKRGLEQNPGNRDAYYNMACVYALKGETEQALRYLRIAALNGYVDLHTLSEDQDLKSLHDHPEFAKIKAGEL